MTNTRSLALLAAAASAAAGMVHAGAAGSHAELTTLATLFGVAAVLQVGWAAAVLVRSSASVVGIGVALHLAVLGVWALSRTVGISAVEGLEAGQSIGFQDGLVVGLQVLAAVAAAASLRSPGPVRALRPVVPLLAIAALVAAVPAMATPHDHDRHDHDVAAAEGELAADGSSHDDEHAAGDHDADEDHGSHAGDLPQDDVADPAATEDLPYPVSFASWLDRAETPEQRAAAEELLVETTEAMQAFPDEAAVQEAGFVSIGDGATGWEHYINVERIMNPAVLDPDDIESVVLKVHPDGTKEVASAMYLLPFGTAMDDAPDIAGDLTPWHDHQNLCWDGVRVVGTTDATGSCPRGELRATQPMIHVWVIEHECGPFAGIEGSHGSGCGHGSDDH